MNYHKYVCRLTITLAAASFGLLVSGASLAHFVSIEGSVEIDNDAYWKTGDGKAVMSSSGCVRSSKHSADNQTAACEGIEEPEPPVVEEPQAEPEPVEEVEEAPPEETTRTLNVAGSALFATNSAELTGDGEAALVDLVSQLREMQEISSIQVEGHTDNRGSVEYNQGLSEQRAQTVADYITSQIPGAPVTGVTGLGEVNPIASNQTAEGRQANRRVEVTVTGVIVE